MLTLILKVLVKSGFFTICIYSNSLHKIHAIHIVASAMHSYSDFHSFMTFFYMVINLIFIVGFKPCCAVVDFILPHTDQTIDSIIEHICLNFS